MGIYIVQVNYAALVPRTVVCFSSGHFRPPSGPDELGDQGPENTRMEPCSLGLGIQKVLNMFNTTIARMAYPGLIASFVLPLYCQTPAGTELFEKEIRPVFAAKCYGCHSSKLKSPMGGLVLDTKAGLKKGGNGGPVIVAGDPGIQPPAAGPHLQPDGTAHAAHRQTAG